jgi:glycosyltransferase involved in cell wall biosynthesis
VPANARLHALRFPSRAQTFLARVGVGADRLLGGVDVVHWTDYVALESTRAPVVVTVHDVIFDERPECYTPEMRRGLDRVMRRAVRVARRFVVPSARTARALAERRGVDPSRIDVVPHGASVLPEAPPAREHGRYVLFVGTLEPRKNLATLLDAHREAARTAGPLRLVVAGPRGWMDEDLVAAMESRDDVVWEGAASRERLAALYRGALALVYPSLAEGFGLPVLEAMALGVPVIVTRGSGCDDLAGGAGVVLDDPRDARAMAGAIVRVVEDDTLRARLRAAGPVRAAAHRWEDAARGTRASYALACGR